MKITLDVQFEEKDYKALFGAMANVSPEQAAAIQKILQQNFNMAAENAMDQAMKQMIKANPMFAAFAPWLGKN